MKQTAVEWLVEQFETTEFMFHDRSSIINKAKEMEKQQICNAWENGYDELDRSGRISLNYYNETYKKPEQ
jgi:hypothetical protein